MKGNKLTLVLITVALFFSLNPGMSSAQNDIHFGVDMTSPVECGLFSQDEGDSVILRGTFNAWAGKDYVLSDPDNDFRYDGKFEIEGDSGTVHEYKYLIQKAGGKLLWEKKPNPENEPHGCRTFHMAGQDQRLDMANFDFDKYYLGSIGKEVIFTVDEMQTDFNMLRQTLENEYCCLYEYTGKEDFDKLFDHQYSLITQPMQPYEFYKIPTPITAKIGCGHTAVWMPGAYWDAGRENLFPLQIKLLEDDMVVKGYYNDTIQVPYGSIIQEINGRPVFDIITEMRENYSADAFNINFINSQIERRFPLIYARRFDFPDKYTINYQNPVLNMVESAELIPANDLQVREVIFSNFHHPPLTFEILQEKNTAILTIPTFIYYDRTDYFTGFIDSCFTTIKENNINNLILDLRGNDGGDPFCAAPLFSYLQPESLPYFAEPYGKYSDFAEPLPLPENHFTGNLIILVDGRCFSTNGHFCALLKYHNICTFVGTETGSTYICNAGRNGIKHLENTGIQLYFGRSSFAAAGKGMDKSKPIEPDYFINL
nr:hypothetical protein [Bacteroidota bacterium]